MEQEEEDEWAGAGSIKGSKHMFFPKQRRDDWGGFLLVFYISTFGFQVFGPSSSSSSSSPSPSPSSPSPSPSSSSSSSSSTCLDLPN